MQNAEVREKALELGFDDVGFTTADPFTVQQELLESRRERYAWAAERGFDFLGGTDPRDLLPGARSIIVLVENYFRAGFPAYLEGKFGRCYLDDDRVTKDSLAPRVRKLRGFLRDRGINTKVPYNLPHRLAAARAGLGNFGKNCFFYAHRAARKGSWVSPITLVVNADFEPDTPTEAVGCPDWCRSACISACPTGAILEPRSMDPRRCISYLSYYGEGITPLEMREPMGMWVYGCDRCQNVCPRNEPWLSQELPPNPQVEAKAPFFTLDRLLKMDRSYYEDHIWPHMFYMPLEDLWRWQMNAARSMGNSRDPAYTAPLREALQENPDERVREMATWSLGRIGGRQAREALESCSTAGESEPVRREVTRSLEHN